MSTNLKALRDRMQARIDSNDWYAEAISPETVIGLIDHIAELERDAAHGQWLKKRFIGADFSWGCSEDGTGGVEVICFRIDAGFRVSGDIGACIDEAIAAQAVSKEG